MQYDMSLFNRLERKFGRWAIPNVTVFLIVGQVLIFAVMTIRAREGGNLLANVVLDPAKVAEGEVWRLITFLFIPFGGGFIWVIFSWILFYLFGTSLEQQWGTFRYNIFLLIGYVANVAAAFLAWGVVGHSVPASNMFLYSTVFLAFARLFPDFTINIYFVLPIKIKWLALLMWLWLGYALLTADGMGRLLVIASVMNYLLFFGREHWRDVRHGQQRRSYQSKVTKAAKRLTHECLVCGNNSEASPKTLFRYCSKCAGQSCYCPEHIGDHEHVVAEEVELKQ